MVEKILCAAIKRIKPREVPRNPYYEGINDILNIELGYRHHDIMIRFHDELDKSLDAQGFYTSEGRFVGRCEATYIAYRAGQINRNLVFLNKNIVDTLLITNNDFPKNDENFYENELGLRMLFSEDLY